MNNIKKSCALAFMLLGAICIPHTLLGMNNITKFLTNQLISERNIIQNPSIKISSKRRSKLLELNKALLVKLCFTARQSSNKGIKKPNEVTYRHIILHNGLLTDVREPSKQKKKIRCQLCKKLFFNITEHKWHCPNNPYKMRPKCTYCKKDFSSPKTLKTHWQKNRCHKYPHPLKEQPKIECQCCNTSIKKENLTRHLDWHCSKNPNRKGPLTCPDCKKKLCNPWYLKYHRDKYCKKNLCFYGKTFRTPSGLKDHIKRGRCPRNSNCATDQQQTLPNHEPPQSPYDQINFSSFFENDMYGENDPNKYNPDAPPPVFDFDDENNDTLVPHPIFGNEYDQDFRSYANSES